MLFSVDGDEGGLIEVRDRDENFYVFIDDLDLFDEREVTDSIGSRAFGWDHSTDFVGIAAVVVVSMQGPQSAIYFCKDDERDVPPAALRRCMGTIFDGLLAGREYVTTPRSEGDQCRKGLFGF